MTTWDSDTKRSDGLFVFQRRTGAWVIKAKGTIVDSCPCCLLPMKTARAARMVADQVYPPPRKPGQ